MMDYMTERITNIAELEKIIESCYMIAQMLKKESPHNESIQLLNENLKRATHFEFCIERRKVSYSE